MAPRGVRSRLATWSLGWNFPLWMLIVLAVLLIGFPLAYLLKGVLWSAMPGASGGHFTLANLAATYGNLSFWGLLLNTVAVAGCTAVFSALVGATLAWIVARSDVRLPRLWANLLAIPLYLSPLMLALALVALGAPRSGLLNVFLHYLRISASPFNCYTFAGIVWVLGSHYASYIFLFMLASMRAIDSSFEEAALVLGTTRGCASRTIGVPLLWPGMLASGVMVATLAAENFAVPAILGAPAKFATVPSEIYYWLAYDQPKPNLAAAAGSVLVLLALAGIVFYQRTVRQIGRYTTVLGKPRSLVRTALGRWAPFVEALLWVYFSLVVLLPVAALLLGSFLSYATPQITWKVFTLSNYADALSGSNFTAFRNTVVLGTGTATVTVLLGAAIGFMVVRSRSGSRDWLDYFTLTGAAIPGIVLGVGMLWAYVGIPLPIYGTLWILFIAYIARYLAHSVRTSASALLHVSSEFEEAAQVLGSGPLRRWIDIVFPLISRGLASAWIIVFIFTVNEVSASIILYSPSSITLSKSSLGLIDATTRCGPGFRLRDIAGRDRLRCAADARPCCRKDSGARLDCGELSHSARYESHEGLCRTPGRRLTRPQCRRRGDRRSARAERLRKDDNVAMYCRFGTANIRCNPDRRSPRVFLRGERVALSGAT